jgi:hypothetical protein
VVGVKTKNNKNRRKTTQGKAWRWAGAVVDKFFGELKKAPTI